MRGLPSQSLWSYETSWVLHNACITCYDQFDVSHRDCKSKSNNEKVTFEWFVSTTCLVRMSIKAPTIGVEKAQTRPTGFIRSFSPPDSSPSEKGLALGSFLSQIFWKDRVVSNRFSKLWVLELLCAYLVRDSQERARGVGKQPQPIRGIRKSFIIFHKMNVTLH